MDTAVGLVSGYLQLNGYFVQTEVPVVERVNEDPPRFKQVTDIDILAVRFPASVHRKPPRETERWAGIVSVDSVLESPAEEMDVIIGEVKEGRTRLNPNLLSPAVLKAALWHTGGCMGADLDEVATGLVETGEARAVHCHGGTQRLRLVVFGGSEPEEPAANYHWVPLAGALGFVRDTLAGNPEVFRVLEWKDPTLSMVLLAWKLGRWPTSLIEPEPNPGSREERG